MLRLLLVILLLFINCLSAFAMPHGTTFQIKNYSVLIPYLAIGIPFSNQDGIELGGTGFNGLYALAAVFSKQVTSSENERSLLNVGALYMYFDSVTGSSGNWSSFVWRGSIIFPVLEYEQERLISERFSWLLNFGWPSLVGFGLKWYL